MRTSQEYAWTCRQTFRAATAQIEPALADASWDALPSNDRERPHERLPTAVIVDVDETVLDNSPYQARLVRDGKPYNEFTWSEWVKEEAARPVPGALEFARAAAATLALSALVGAAVVRRRRRR